METVVLQCSDFGPTGPCCADCRATPVLKTVVYPKSGMVKGAPDLGMGIRAHICCNHIHQAQRKTRTWWYEKYLRGTGRFTENEIQKGLLAVDGMNFYRVFGEIHEEARNREMKGIKIKTVLVKKTGCPKCGGDWNDVVCETCGFAE